VYWNTHADSPLVWSVDRGETSTEVHVREVYFAGVTIMTHHRPAADNITEPRGWVECYGAVEILHDRATITSISEV